MLTIQLICTAETFQNFSFNLNLSFLGKVENFSKFEFLMVGFSMLAFFMLFIMQANREYLVSWQHGSVMFSKVCLRGSRCSRGCLMQIDYSRCLSEAMIHQLATISHNHLFDEHSNHTFFIHRFLFCIFWACQFTIMRDYQL